jgi:hypothetical protein
MALIAGAIGAVVVVLLVVFFLIIRKRGDDAEGDETIPPEQAPTEEPIDVGGAVVEAPRFDEGPQAATPYPPPAEVVEVQEVWEENR